eukprot:TRINITY_DN484_c2_g3_i1.p2 TRINITY_DN484_c2_g3~~TRINITY_DN484_c2_g3_i1.p2  ORF type:complete len:174 (-),score=75.37 TRINITY_DN484_c2_g3_i1:12-533(-)
MIISHMPYGPTAYFALNNCVMRHDVDEHEHVPLIRPHLVFENFKTKLGERVATILKHLFPVPKEDAKRVMTFCNNNDYISFRHHLYEKTGPKTIELKEMGPRFEMMLYSLKLGTMDQKEAESEWALRPYMRTAKFRSALSDTPFAFSDGVTAVEEEETSSSSSSSSSSSGRKK